MPPEAAGAARQRVGVLGAPIDAISPHAACARVMAWGAARESRYVCLTNVHSVVTARHDPAFARVLAEADLATPDGAPVAWMLRRLGVPGQQRVSGTELMLDCMDHAERTGQGVFLLGSTEATLAALSARLMRQWPRLRIVGTVSPPFRPLSAEEDAALVERINASGAGTVWVSLGCPKQELWMAAHRGRVHGVMLGVGAAFDFLAGTVARAPGWMQRFGLEWLHRLASEPGRLWKRYLVTNTRFVLGAARQLLGPR